jgi:predicted nucleotidyltransferase
MNLSKQLDNALVELYRVINEVAEELGIPFLVVGASARDLVFEYVYGMNIQRATKDVDFGIQIASWSEFEIVKEELKKKGFKETKNAHRLESQYVYPIDIVPFGGVEDHEANIEWPPLGEQVMKVLGFSEAFEHADIVNICDNPALKLKVASPIGLTLMKFIAWQDRSFDKRRKDATDLHYMLISYEKLPGTKLRLYDDLELLELYDGDISLIGAHLLGQDSREIASKGTSDFINKIVSDNKENGQIELLASEMNTKHDIEVNVSLLAAFGKGFGYLVES